MDIILIQLRALQLLQMQTPVLQFVYKSPVIFYKVVSQLQSEKTLCNMCSDKDQYFMYKSLFNFFSYTFS